MSYIIGIDPGPEQSGVVIYKQDTIGNGPSVRYPEVLLTAELIAKLEDMDCWPFAIYEEKPPTLAIEMPCFYGKSVSIGKDVLNTAAIVGRCEEAFATGWDISYGPRIRRVTRREVRMHLCGTMRAGDPQVWQALCDRYGGRKAAVGTKKAPGPLYGVRSHAKAALAVAITAAETKA